MNGWQQLWHGISPCMEPGVGGCVVWWDAWAVLIAAFSVGATVFLGVMTLRLGVMTFRLGRITVGLGRSANRAANLAAKIAAQEAERRADLMEDERILVLMELRAEVGASFRRLTNAFVAMEGPGDASPFVMDPVARGTAVASIMRNKFTTAKSLRGRLHYIGQPLAGSFAFAIGMSDLLIETFEGFDLQQTKITPADMRDGIVQSVYHALENLRPVNEACKQVAVDLGIDR
ncbi:TPA: hypothetical protein ACKQBZ_004690 [Stenotrophomonas maltophilia]